MNVPYDPLVRLIPIKQINVLNPRERGKKKFAQIMANIAKLGLKKPITVALAGGTNGDSRYDLVCGQGRLEACASLGDESIHAIVVEGARDELLLMSLIENLARRSPTTMELVGEVRSLKNRKYTVSEIARKIDLDPSYVRGILQLLDRGEERLLQAVEKGQLPVSVAIIIATSDDQGVQRALQEAYERHDLKGKDLIRARRVFETRRCRGKRPRGGPRRPRDRLVSADQILKTFQQETARQKSIVQKAKLCEMRLVFAVSALKQLFQDEHFVTLLRAEELDSLPQYLAEQIYDNRGAP